MKLEDLVVGQTYARFGKRVVFVGPWRDTPLYCQIRDEDCRPCVVEVSQLQPLREAEPVQAPTRFERNEEAAPREVFVVDYPASDPFEYPRSLVGFQVGLEFQVMIRVGSKLGNRIGTYPTHETALAGATYVASLGPLIVPLEKKEYVVVAGGVDGTVLRRIAQTLSLRLFGQSFNDKGQVRLSQGNVVVHRPAWEALPEAQRDRLLPYLDGFKVGFDAGWGEEREAY